LAGLSKNEEWEGRKLGVGSGGEGGRNIKLFQSEFSCKRNIILTALHFTFIFLGREKTVKSCYMKSMATNFM
jgi:hypothetical protein